MLVRGLQGVPGISRSRSENLKDHSDERPEEKSETRDRFRPERPY
jgi:hypothetical protein